MVELLDYLTANGFATYIVSGGGRDFMRPISQQMYGVPREQVIGSSTTFAYTSDDARRHDLPQARGRLSRRRPRRSLYRSGIASVVARCSPRETPTATCRCSNSPTTPAGRPLSGSSSCHDDPEREFDYTTGGRSWHSAKAEANGWTIVSIKSDWASAFASSQPATAGSGWSAPARRPIRQQRARSGLHGQRSNNAFTERGQDRTLAHSARRMQHRCRSTCAGKYRGPTATIPHLYTSCMPGAGVRVNEAVSYVMGDDGPGGWK